MAGLNKAYGARKILENIHLSFYPDAFNHGTSEQRRYRIRRGFGAGRIEQCDTFNAAEL